MSEAAAIERVLRKNPDAIRIGDFTFRETAYGVVKRLRFFVDAIESERRRRGIAVDALGALRILDVGCGTGTYVTIPLAAIGYSVVGIDLDRASIERARENAVAAGVNAVQLHCGAAETLPLERAHVVICTEVLEHQRNPEAFLRTLDAKLVDDGLLLLTVPNGYGSFEIESAIGRLVPHLPHWTDRCERWLVRRLGSETQKRRVQLEHEAVRLRMEASSLASGDVEHHEQRFTPRALRQLLERERYQVERFRGTTLLAGNAVNAAMRSLDFVLAWNGRAADVLPAWAAADWLVAARTIRPGRTSSSSSRQKEEDPRQGGRM